MPPEELLEPLLHLLLLQPALGGQQPAVHLPEHGAALGRAHHSISTDIYSECLLISTENDLNDNWLAAPLAADDTGHWTSHKPAIGTDTKHL